MYGVMFTCLCSRAIHIEVAQSLETDSFIFSLRRFIGNEVRSAWWDLIMVPTILVLLRSFENPSKRWIIIKYHNIYKDAEPTG